MRLAFASDEANPLVAALLAELRVPRGAVPVAIHERDEMLGALAEPAERERALFAYFRVGASIAQSLLELLRWRFGSDLGRLTSLLDFASGYGRVTRFLLPALTARRIWVSDVYADGVAFQQQRFGVHGLVSSTRPEDFDCARRFDAICVTSLFTHLPEGRFEAWLRKLGELLNPGGVLVFSTHGADLAPSGEAMPGAGLLFMGRSESKTLDPNDYGSTWVTDAFVRAAAARALGPDASLHRLPRALCNFQDVYVALREPAADFSGLGFRGEPLLFVDELVLREDGVLHLAGRAGTRTGSPTEVRLAVDGKLLATAPVEAGAGLRDWSCEAFLPPEAAPSFATIGVVDDRGRLHPLWVWVDAARSSPAPAEP